MSEAYEWYDKLKAASAASNKDRIKQVLKADVFELQPVLQLKMSCSELEDDEHFCFYGNDKYDTTTYGFNEKLVNRLMHLAYLYGCQDIEKKSFENGYQCCKKDFAKELEKLNDQFRVYEDD